VITGWSLGTLDSYTERRDFRHGSTDWSRVLIEPDLEPQPT
jgi:hypothetical protein